MTTREPADPADVPRAAPGTPGAWAPTVAFAGLHLAAVPALDAVQALNDEAAAVWNALCRGEAVDGPAARACAEAWREAGLFADVAAAEPAPVPPLPKAWALGATIRAFGRSARIRVEDADLGAALADQLAPCRADDLAAEHRIELVASTVGQVLVEDGRARPAVSDRLRARGSVINALLQIGCRHGDWLGWLHGGCVADGERAWLVLGTGGSGKSTLGASLVDAGLRLVADDVVPLTASGVDAVRVLPVPFAASVKSGSWPLLAQAFPDLDAAREHALGPRRVRYLALPPERRALGPLPVAAVVFPRWAAGAEPAVTRLAPLDVLARLTDGSSWLDLRLPSLRRLARWIEATPAFALHYATSEQAVAGFARIAAG